MRICVVYHAGYSYIEATFNYVDSFSRSAAHDIHYFNVDQAEPVSFAGFDAVIVTYDVVCLFRAQEGIPFDIERALTAYTGIKVVAVQDEYDFTDRTNAFLARIGSDIILTVVPQDHAHKIYPPEQFPNTQLLSVLTGYVSVTEERPAIPLSERPIVLGYRGRELPYRCGELGWHKAEIGHRFKLACANRGIPHDIAVDEASRFYADQWLRFVGSCRAMLGVPSGSNVFDRDGSLHEMLVAKWKVEPGFSFETVRDEIAAREVDFDMGQVSPRIFEAVSCRTAMVLLRGNYSGIVEPEEHYIPVERDYGNLEEVLDRLQDMAALEAMADRAYCHVMRDCNRYDAFVARIERAIEARHTSGPIGQIAIATTRRPLGSDPYLYRCLVNLNAEMRKMHRYLTASIEGRLIADKMEVGSYRMTISETA